MVSVLWLDVGYEEEREIKDETQVPRKSTCCATASEHTRKTGLGEKMLKIVLSLRYLRTFDIIKN